ncbi:MAG: hypothetical protein IR158_08850 [Cellulomonas sp.]|uniref:hypothetical protein n=1 Tax=Cellulomonas sp. TaxID=40001 RepID=UPI0019EF24F4|nr:hypothetical protein [Cellulomonas sp.]MBF0687855.1 hypothetical protein [Cellulomonas sp.]
MTRISTAGAAVGLALLMTVGGAATAQAAPVAAPSVLAASSGDLTAEARVTSPFGSRASSVVSYDRDRNTLTTTLSVTTAFLFIGARAEATTTVHSATGEPLWTVTQKGATPCGTWVPTPCTTGVETREHTPPAVVADLVQQRAARVVTTVTIR